jgi:SecD/SecF fusion protein
MKNLKELLPTSMVWRWLLIVFAFATACSVGPDFYRQAIAAEPKGDVLLYEVDPDALEKDQKVNMDTLVKAIDRRLNPGWFRQAQVRKADKQQIEISLPKQSKLDKKQVERLLSCTGDLQFRVLANNRDNKKLIERALAEPSKMRLLDSNGKLEAWWAPVKEEEVDSLSHYNDIARRERKKEKETITDVLLLPDEYNVTGAFLSRAVTDTDDQGRPCLRFTFNKEGGQRFGQLTGSHLPDEVNRELTYKLGIVLDGTVHSAPAIQSTITSSGQITGSFTKEQVDDFARVLNAGRLPARIRPVKK